MEKGEVNWSEDVEDLVTAGDTQAAIFPKPPSRTPSDVVVSGRPPDSKVTAPKRRGRETFSYRKSKLYGKWLSEMSVHEDTENEDVCKNPEAKTMESKYGTCHVLVLVEFSPSTRTTDLEKLFEDFRD
ncbi:uncharacterized protein LOC111301243 isoform X2 [Durio zibethinus]|uniref:Uncharacterized protein LOC111301243 isoform X2 n=1 Tax=Durio zibethinus TaxID=66656 RepID=A0A6P5ZJC8_DURZI|nr:uncharacterized protein LOC111301243 isoform X2 [Durio zibethinus]